MSNKSGQLHPSSRLRNHLIKGAAGSFVLQVGFAGFSFLNAIILARVLGAGGYGAFANAMAWVSLLTIPATFGFGILLVRDVAIYRSHLKWGLLKGLLRFSNRFVLVLSVLLALVAAVVAAFVFKAPEQQIMRVTLWVALLLLPLFSLYNLRESTLRGLECVIRARLPGMIIRPGLLLAGIVAIYSFWPQHLSAPVAMVVNIGAGIGTLGAGMFWLRRLLPLEVKTASVEYELRPWLKAAYPMLIYGGANVVLGQTDIIMLGAMRGEEAVGLYAAASRLAYLLMYVTVAIELIMEPIMSRLYANGDKARLQMILSRALRITFFSVLPLGLIFIFAGKNLLIIFGQNFVVAWKALAILATGRLVYVALGLGGVLLSMTGHEKTVAMVMTVTSLANVLLNALLIPKFGIEGAAYATVVSLTVTQLLLGFYAVKRLNLHVTICGTWLRYLSV